MYANSGPGPWVPGSSGPLIGQYAFHMVFF